MSDVSDQQLIKLALNLQREADTLVPALLGAGELDVACLARMEFLRCQILTSKPVTPVDRLVIFGCMRAVVAFIWATVTVEHDDPATSLEIVRHSMGEVLLGIATLNPKLESDAGLSLEALGVFVDRKTLQ
ncbi:MAG: hypothetical protein ABIN69_07290 [Aestuariivirga sp.]